MNYALDKTGTPQGLSDAITECRNKYDPDALMILAGNDNGFTPERIDSLLRNLPVPVLGGTFPGIFCGDQLLQRGSLVMALPEKPRIQIVDGLGDDGREFDDQLDDNLLGESGKTMIVLVDGLAMRVDTLLSSLFCLYGMEVNYLGGGAGALAPVSRPCLITNRGLIRNAAILAVFDMASGVGVSHGMQTVSGPHMVSDVRGNRIGCLDWQPARERFQALIGAIDPSLADKTGFPISKEFCLAINRIGGEKVVRDPFKADADGSLHVVSQLSEGSFVDLVRATPDSTIQAAAKALKRAGQSYSGTEPYQSLLCFDCFTRWDFLGNRFSEEIAALQDGRCTLLGALTLGGEVANTGRDFLDYYNRSCVVSVLGGGP